jgi:hypothetical protein
METLRIQVYDDAVNPSSSVLCVKTDPYPHAWILFPCFEMWFRWGYNFLYPTWRFCHNELLQCAIHTVVCSPRWVLQLQILFRSPEKSPTLPANDVNRQRGNPSSIRISLRDVTLHVFVHMICPRNYSADRDEIRFEHLIRNIQREFEVLTAVVTKSYVF